MDKQSLAVSCVLICYNQQQYIDEAVKGVLSQSYDVGEFIFSDDCSTDDTFAKLKLAVDKYGAGKNIVVRKNASNMGLIAHVNAVMVASTGELVVIAAGDDISFPNRVAKIVETYLAAGRPMLLHSKAVAIDGHGVATGNEFPDVSLRKKLTVEESLLSQRIYLGASGAWSRDLIDKYGPISYRHTYEDLTMGFRAVLEGKIEYIDECLLAYRVDVGLSAAKKLLTGADRAANRRAKIRREKDIFLQRRDDIERFGGVGVKAERKLKQKIRLVQIRSHFYENRLALLRDMLISPINFLDGVGGEVKFLIKYVFLK